MDNRITPYQMLSERMARSIIRRADVELTDYTYVTGLGLECVGRCASALHHEEWWTWVGEWFGHFLHENGELDGYSIEEYSFDQLSPGKCFFHLYQVTGNPKYKIAMDIMYQQILTQPRTQSGGFWHKKIYPNQMWLDGLYMYGTFLMQYASLYGDFPHAVREMVFQFDLMYEKALNSRNGLLYHAWDESRKMPWSDIHTGCSSCVWGRAEGWYCMALVEVLDLIPETKEFSAPRARLIELSNRLAQALFAVQDDESGLWYQVLDQGGRMYNYLETSASTMFVYFLFHMVHRGYAYHPEIVRKAAWMGWKGLLKYKVTSDEDGELHMKDICKGAGVGQYALDKPYRDGTYEYYTEREPKVMDNPQGTGVFILAALEVAQEPVNGMEKSPESLR
ncbi:MAG: glycoside hydrolase family 88 protein [Sphaerochaetaceae bacterium]|jgi:unsaturated rhamnogalacturonyl hydrolase|nr:glycoside hydrolase family 88 protein [Bacteroidales bacterium]